jgi:hypothetical protein
MFFFERVAGVAGEGFRLGHLPRVHELFYIRRILHDLQLWILVSTNLNEDFSGELPLGLISLKN